MEKNYLITLIRKHLRGQTTPAERAYLEQWWQYFKQDDSYLKALSNDERQQLRDQMLTNIWEQIDEQEPVVKPLPTPSRSLWPIALRWAASIAVSFLIGAVAYRYLNSSSTVIETVYGQHKTVRLPDGSVVRLNGNSSLHYAADWTETVAANQSKREVWLTGEGYFDIRTIRRPDGQKTGFTVHTSGLDINVLGTGFNVSDRRGRVSVVLQHGAVRVVDRQQPTKSVLMQPGDRVVQAPNQKLALQRVNPQLYTSWQGHQLRFQQTRLADIFAQLEDSYGLTIQCNNPQLLNEVFTGEVPTDSLPLFFDRLEKLFPVRVARQGTSYRLD